MTRKVNPTEDWEFLDIKGKSAPAAAKGGVNSVEVAGDLLRALSETACPTRLAGLGRQAFKGGKNEWQRAARANESRRGLRACAFDPALPLTAHGPLHPF